MRFDNVSEFETQRDEIDLDLGDGRRISVRHSGAGNRGYRHAMAQFYLKHRRAIDNSTLPLEQSDRAEMAAFAEHVVTGWRGFRAEGVDAPYSVAACVALFEQAPALFEQVREEAQRLANFREEDAVAGDEALGKS